MKPLQRFNISKIRAYQKENPLINRFDQKVTGTLDLKEYPEYPVGEFPSKADCSGFIFMSMNQMCNISEKAGHGRSAACHAFGGDRGKIPVQPDRQTWEWKQGGHRIRKFVFVSAVAWYFQEVGIDW